MDNETAAQYEQDLSEQEPSEYAQVRICGYGGQGIVLTGLLLGKAASLYDGKEAVFTQSYGPEARGGASSADVVISNKPVDYPLVTELDVLLVLFQEAYWKYKRLLKPSGILIVEADLVHPGDDDPPCYAIPSTRMATELGRAIVSNVVSLGYLVGLTDIVTPESVIKAIETTVKPKTIDLNKRAFEAGFERAAKQGAPV